MSTKKEQETPQSLRISGIDIPVTEQSPLVLALLVVIQKQDREIQELRDEIQRLKKTTRRPKIKPSRLLKPPPADTSGPKKKRPGSVKRHKTKALRIDLDQVIQPDDLPPGARLEGYRDFVVQDLAVETRNTRYRRAVYRLPDGTLLVAQRPAEVDSHFGPALREFILLQAHQNHVTQGRLLEHLRELGVDISAGQLSGILLKGHENFHAEKDELLPTARQISGYLHCDDTSARHQGKAAVCTHIGNELFASFSTTDSKSRLNFLRLLCQPEEQYRWCEEASESLGWLGASGKLQARMNEQADGVWSDREAWEEQLNRWGVTSETHRRQVSEAALFGKLLTETWYDDLGLVSDDAPQFKLFGFVHGLCWVHGERKIDRLIPLTTRHRQAKEQAQDKFWELYKRLQAYRLEPTETAREAIEGQFDQLCQTKTGYPDLNEALGLLGAKRDAFLAVLEYPHLPLHNNLSENDIREYARLRKISGGTRSDTGRRCRDTFMSLKKTCRKLGVSFQSYLRDRLTGRGEIPLLADLMRTVANASPDPVAVTTRRE
jgi:hypothetical protein